MVMTAQSAATRRMEKIMTAYTISEQNEIVAHATREEAAPNSETRFDTFSTEQELAELAAVCFPLAGLQRSHAGRQH
jgi:hypothetical protein